MHILNLVVAVAFVISGTMLLLGYLTGNGAISGLATYFGVPLMAYSIAAYLVSLTVYLVRRQGSYWDSLYSVNFGFSLLAYASLEFVPKYFPMGAIIALAVGIASGLVLRKAKIQDFQFSPLILPGTLVLVAVPFIRPYWSLYFLVVSICLMILTSYDQVWKKFAKST